MANNIRDINEKKDEQVKEPEKVEVTEVKVEESAGSAEKKGGGKGLVIGGISIGSALLLIGGLIWKFCKK